MKALAVLLVLSVATPAWAGVDYKGGKVVSDGQNYDGPGLGVEDLALLGVGAGLLANSLTWADGGRLIGPASFLVWGALRTAKYRPESVKAQIRSEIAARNARPVPGSVEELLQ